MRLSSIHVGSCSRGIVGCGRRTMRSSRWTIKNLKFGQGADGGSGASPQPKSYAASSICPDKLDSRPAHEAERGVAANVYSALRRRGANQGRVARGTSIDGRSGACLSYPSWRSQLTSKSGSRRLTVIFSGRDDGDP